MIEFYLNGVRLLADVSGALVWPDKKTVIFSDLHLEKASWFAQQKKPIPPYDTVDTLDRVDNVIKRFKPTRIISIGDSFHDDKSMERIPEVQRERILRFTKNFEWLWVQGNHDPSGAPLLGGISIPEYLEKSLIFRHEAKRLSSPGEISGHYHPKARVKLRHRNFTAPCFITDGTRIILPAFGSFTGGLNVTNTAISSLFENDFNIFLIGLKVRQFPKSALLSTG